MSRLNIDMCYYLKTSRPMSLRYAVITNQSSFKNMSENHAQGLQGSIEIEAGSVLQTSYDERRLKVLVAIESHDDHKAIVRCVESRETLDQYQHVYPITRTAIVKKIGMASKENLEIIGLIQKRNKIVPTTGVIRPEESALIA